MSFDAEIFVNTETTNLVISEDVLPFKSNHSKFDIPQTRQ